MSWIPFVLAGALLFAAAQDFPRFGDPESPPATHVSPRYVQDAIAEAGAPNMVTAVLADYRSYDTLGETVVIFTAGLACLLILGMFQRDRSTSATDGHNQLTEAFGSDVLDATSRLLSPFIMMFAIYVVVHGHDSPGGGFQGGTVLAAAFILMRLIRGQFRESLLTPARALAMAAVGVLIYAGIGWLAIFYSYNFLDYAALPLPYEGPELRHFGSLGIEIGVFLAVTAVLLMIFDALTAGAED